MLCYLLGKYLKLAMLNLTNLSCWEAENTVNIIVKVSYSQGNIDIVQYRENSQKLLTAFQGWT